MSLDLDKIEAENQPKEIPVECPHGIPGCMVLHLSGYKVDNPEKRLIRTLISELRIEKTAIQTLFNQYEEMKLKIDRYTEIMNVAELKSSIREERLQSAEEALKAISQTCHIELGECPQNKMSKRLSDDILLARAHFEKYNE